MTLTLLFSQDYCHHMTGKAIIVQKHAVGFSPKNKEGLDEESWKWSASKMG